MRLVHAMDDTDSSGIERGNDHVTDGSCTESDDASMQQKQEADPGLAESRHLKDSVQKGQNKPRKQKLHENGSHVVQNSFICLS